MSAVRIVLVEPTHPGNIGAVARAMKTMGLSDLTLVNPLTFPHVQANQRSAGAEDVLNNARVVTELDQALQDCTLIAGTSVRDREVAWPTVDPRRLPEKAHQHFLENVPNARIAILFGRESSGLKNDELDRCQLQIRIEANPEYSSLNLASAVQIVAYEMRMQAMQAETVIGHSSGIETVAEPSALEARQQRATQAQQAGFMHHLQTTIEALDFVKSKPPIQLMRKLTRLYQKAELSVEEVQILRGILTAIQSQLRSSTSPTSSNQNNK